MTIQSTLWAAALFLSSIPALAETGAILERRNWIEKAFEEVAEPQCEDKVKTWRCLFPLRASCMKEMKAVYSGCAQSSLPDLPEYIDGPTAKEEATKVIFSCMAMELSKKHVITLSPEKMQEYNECTGVAPRSKPLNPNLLKAEEFSKTQTASTCAASGFIRKCFSIEEKACKDLVVNAVHACTMKLDAQGMSVKSEEGAIQEVGRKITDCGLEDFRKAIAGKKKQSKDKDCE